MGNRNAPLDAAKRLAIAHRDGAAVAPPSTAEALEIEDAYAVQSLLVTELTGDGVRSVGYKVGVTAAEAQRRFGLKEPTYGRVLSDVLFGTGETVWSDSWVAPRIEPELALVLASDLTDPDLDDDAVSLAVSRVAVAFEIVDSRLSQGATITDLIADNGSSGGAIVAAEGRAPALLKGRRLECVFLRNGEELPSGAPATIEESIGIVGWLARTLVRRGSALRAGDIVLTGALAPAVPLRRGDRFEATVSGVGHAEAMIGR